MTGAGAGGCGSNGGDAGVGPTDGTAAPAPSCGSEGGFGAASAGSAAMGGDGDSSSSQANAPGGGGGGGWFGGGGGGGVAGGGGGGGGSSYGGAGPSGGVSIATASSKQAPEVVIGYKESRADGVDYGARVGGDICRRPGGADQVAAARRGSAARGLSRAWIPTARAPRVGVLIPRPSVGISTR